MNINQQKAGETALSPAGIKTAWIPAGTFTMGSPPDEKGRVKDEGNQRQVTISRGFWIGVYPITQQEWARVRGSNPSEFSGNPAAGETQGRRPVEYVNWYDALVFANQLSIMEGLSPAYSIEGKTDPDEWLDMTEDALDTVEIAEGSQGWRLPTEAQWEYAARAGTAAAFSNGAQDWEDEASVDGIGWFEFNSDGMTHEVGLKQPNPWGLYDMHGNVWEWVWDRFDDYPAQAQTDPAGASLGPDRVYRGGSWANSVQGARSAARNVDDPFIRDPDLGLRLVRP